METTDQGEEPTTEVRSTASSPKASTEAKSPEHFESSELTEGQDTDSVKQIEPENQSEPENSQTEPEPSAEAEKESESELNDSTDCVVLKDDEQAEPTNPVETEESEIQNVEDKMDVDERRSEVDESENVDKSKETVESDAKEDLTVEGTSKNGNKDEEMEVEYVGENTNSPTTKSDVGSEKESDFTHVNVEQSESAVEETSESSPKNNLAEIEEMDVDMDQANADKRPDSVAKQDETSRDSIVISEDQRSCDTDGNVASEKSPPVAEESSDREIEKSETDNEKNDTEFVQITQDKNDDSQIESHSMDAEDPFGADNMQCNESTEQNEKDAEVRKATLEKLGEQADNLQDFVNAQGKDLSSPKEPKSPEDTTKSIETEKPLEKETESEVIVEGDTGKKSSDKSDAVDEIIPGQDDELCIIPDSMKIMIPPKESKDKESKVTSEEENKEVSVSKSCETEEKDEEKEVQNDEVIEKIDEKKDKATDGDVMIVDEKSKEGSDEVEEISSEEICKQCKKKKPCKFVAKVGLESFNVCSKACKMAFQDDNNKSTDIPSDGVSSKKEKRCANCLLIVEANDERSLSWETMEFCNEECLGKFQTKYGSYCRNCNGAVQSVSLGKYCVRFGYDVRQFCCSTCLEEFKKGLKVCSYCQKDISAGTEGFLAPVGDKGQFKDFCTQECMEKYSRMSSSEPVAPEKKPCGVCQEDKIVFCEVQVDRTTPVPICSEPCFAAFKFVNKVDPSQCSTCKKYFENSNKKSFVVFYEQDAHSFCSKTCLNVFIITNRKIVPCNWCKVKKYNFDMIKRELKIGQVIMMCSLNCLTLYQVSINAVSAKRIRCDYCKEFSQAQYHLTMSDATIRNFCSYNCVMNFQGQYTKSPITIPSSDDPVPTGLPKRTLPAPPRGLAPTIKPVDMQQKKTLPVISSVTSLASITNGQTIEASSPATVTKTTVGVQPMTQATGQPHVIYKQQVITRPPSPVKMSNKMTSCKPITHTKGIYVRPRQSTVSTQTDDELKIVIPIPVPIYVPYPVHMFSLPFPVPVPIAIPVPVPIFIPTTRNSAKGIMKEMKRIQEKMPSDPFEAELLMMAEMVATEKKAESDSDSADENRVDGDEQTNTNSDSYSPEGVDANNAFEEDVLQMALKMASGEMEEPAVDLEAALTTNTITPSQGQTQSDANLENEAPSERLSSSRGRKRTATYKSRGGLPSKRGRKSSASTDMSLVQQQDNQPATPQPRFMEPAEKPDANMALKYTFGVNAWRQWVVAKNAELEKQNTVARKMKLFKMDILQLTADELNYSLCLFVKEVRKPNGSEYAPDTIYYLCLGIQQYLFENNRIDNIFTDPYYEKFTDCLDEVAKKFATLYNDAQYIVTRVEEEHLWESQQLGAHSPHVLLNTLMYFNTKHFNLVSVDEHMQLSFSHIMKHWKRNPAAQQSAVANKLPGSRNVLLRFYPPQSTLDANTKKKKVYEQQENEDNPLRCPVKLYEFYLSKCPESVKTRNDIFYLLPERSCVPDSPVWYSTSPLAKEQLMKMLHRIKMVKEINIALLNS